MLILDSYNLYEYIAPCNGDLSYISESEDEPGDPITNHSKACMWAYVQLNLWR